MKFNQIAALAAGAIVVSAGVANAGAVSKVENGVKIETGTTNTRVDVNTDFSRQGWDKYSNVSTKVDYINESIALPDGLGTKDIYTEIEAVSRSSGMSDFSENTTTNVHQNSSIDTLLDQTVYGSAGVTYQ